MRFRELFTALLLAVIFTPLAISQELDRMIEQASANYATRIETAADELNSIRKRVGDEKVTLARATRLAEQEVISLEAEFTRLKTVHASQGSRQAQTLRELDLLRENIGYSISLIEGGLKGVESTLVPGERESRVNALGQLKSGFAAASHARRIANAIEVSQLLVSRQKSLIGGELIKGQAMTAGDNRVFEGTFALVGPESYFKSDTGNVIGVVRSQEGTRFSTVYPNNNFDIGVFEGNRGQVMADVSGGKALRLQQAKGNGWDHIRKGGVVAYFILALGLIAFLTTAIKLLDLRHMSVDSPLAIRSGLEALASNSLNIAEERFASLKQTTRELFEVGMKHVGKPKSVLEEHLYASTLMHRIRHERRLPLIRVIAAAAPLLGLLGTVVGMVKTFTLITVFGTGNAEKLSSGISEALVTTELGLIVAIPSLIIYGYLSQKAQRNLSLLEQYAVEFVAAAEESKQGESEDAL